MDQKHDDAAGKPKQPGEAPIITVTHKNPNFQQGDDPKTKYVQDLALWKKGDAGKEYFDGFVMNAEGEKKKVVAFFRKDAGQSVEGGGTIPTLTIKEDVKKGEDGNFVGAAWPVNSRADGTATDVDFSTLYMRFDDKAFQPNEKGVVYAHVWHDHSLFGFNEAPRPIDAKPEAAPAEQGPAQSARSSGGPGR